MRKMLWIAMFLMGILSCLFAEPTKAQSGTLPPIFDHEIVKKAFHAETPQLAVSEVVTAFATVSETHQATFAGGADFHAEEGEIWLVATDWLTISIPAGVTPVNVTGGYGAWLISGEWSGHLHGGLGILVQVPEIIVPPNHALVSAVLATDSAQESVQVVSNHFDTTSEENRRTFASPSNFDIPQGETWVFATDWSTTIPAEANPLKTEGGYGSWWISGPWTGTVNSGLAVRLVFDNQRYVFLPLVSRQLAAPNHPLVSAVLATDSAQESVQVVSNHFDTTSEENRRTFASPSNFDIPQGETWVFATDWSTTIPAEANPLKTEGGYGSWWISGPWTGTVNSGLAVRIK